MTAVDTLLFVSILKGCQHLRIEQEERHSEDIGVLIIDGRSYNR